MQRCIQVALVGVLALAMVSGAVAQETVDLGGPLSGWIEVGDDVLMRLLASTNIRYRWTSEADFEHRLRDRVISRDNLSTNVHLGEGTSWLPRHGSGSTCGMGSTCSCRFCSNTSPSWTAS